MDLCPHPAPLTLRSADRHDHVTPILPTLGVTSPSAATDYAHRHRSRLENRLGARARAPDYDFSHRRGLGMPAAKYDFR